MVSKIFIKN